METLLHARAAQARPVRAPHSLLARGVALWVALWLPLAAQAAADYIVTITSDAIVVTDAAGNSDTLTISEPSAGHIQFDASGRTFSVNGGAFLTNDSGVLSRSNINSITINAGAGADTIGVAAFTGTLPSLTINGGIDDDTVLFYGDITFTPDGSLNVDLQNDAVTSGADVVQLLSDANLLASGSGAITVKCSKSVYLDPGSSLETVDGNLTVAANQQATPTSGNFLGIIVNAALLRCTGTGQVNVNGRGGDDEGGGQLGILVVDAGQIMGGTTGGLTVIGTGGDSTNWINRGVTVYAAGALISSLGGPVQVIGQSGSVGSFYGIGVALLFGGTISAGGTGTVTVEGTGAGFGGFNVGIEMGVIGSAITSGGGDIEVRGIAGPGGSEGIFLGDASSITNPAPGGSIALISDSIYIENNAGVGVAGPGGTVTIKAENNAVPIDLGGGDTDDQLGLTDEELDRITAGTIIIGDTSNDSIVISAPISPENAGALNLVSSGGIYDSDDYAGTDVTVANLTTSGTLSPGNYIGIFSVDGNVTLAANSTFTVDIEGGIPGDSYDQLSATGTVDIGANVTLDPVNFGEAYPDPGSSYTIISRSGGSGTFADLPEGAILPDFLFSGLDAFITYVGGAGDDVVIAMLAPEIVVEQPVGTNLEDSILTDQYAATVLDFSSAYGGLDGGWGATQVLGVPDTFDYGDISTAWSGSEIDGTLEFITVGFVTPVYATGVTVRETWANGFVYQIDVVDADDVLHTVWTGIDPSPPGSPADFLITWAPTPYLVKGVKVYVDTDHVIGEWEEIDSIQLHGTGSSVVNFGAVNLGSSSNLTFTIRNTGGADLTGLGITIDGADAGDFAVTANPTAPLSGPSGTTTFTVTFTPAAGGTRSAALHIASNDSDENPFDVVLSGRGVPPVAIITNGLTLAAENCGAPNGRLDPNETVTVLFSLQNVGFENSSEVTTILEESGGVVAPSGAQSYGTLPPDGSAARAFTFMADAPCGGSVTATLQIQTNGIPYGTVTYHFPLGSSSIIFSENFDAATVPDLPAGWTTYASPGQSSWVTSSNEYDTPLNAAFSPQTGSAGFNELVSPIISIQSASAVLTFRQFHDLDDELDGGVLEIKIGEGVFEDILVAGGSFAGGGYNETLEIGSSNPLAGRQAWSGNAGEGSSIFTTTVNLPAAAAGESIRLRWLRGIDSGVSSTGWYVDTITISDVTCCSVAPEIAVQQPAGTDLTDGDADIGFGSVSIGNSMMKIFLITNSGSAALNLYDIAVYGPNSAEFTAGPPGVMMVSPGAATTFSVTFAPAALGSRMATLEIWSDDSDENPFEIELAGLGTPPPVTITCPGDIFTNVFNFTNTVAVAWPDPVAMGTPAPVVLCVPPSGSMFPAGTTTVTCTATNTEGTNFCTFIVTICPAYIQVTSVEDSGPGSLRQAIADLCPGGTIEFDPALAGATITLTNGEIVITNDMTIRGLGANQLTVSGNNISRVFRIGEVTAHLSHLTLADGYAYNAASSQSAASGGAILNDGNLTLSSCALVYNFAPGYGGALAGGTRANTCTISNCTFSGNSAGRGGGALAAGVVLPPAPVTYEMLGRASRYSSVNVNSAGRNWDIVAPGTTVTLTADYDAFYTDGLGCPGCITQHYLGINDVFSDCHDASFGSSSGTINRTFTAPAVPGIYYITQTASWWFFCYQFGVPDFPNDPGSAVAVLIVGSPANAASTVSIHNSTFSDNFAGNSGGALDINAYATVEVVSATISDNSAPEGGGVNVVAPDGVFVARNVIVAGNSHPTAFAGGEGETSGLGGNSFDVKGFISSAGHNLIGDSQGASGFDVSDILDTNAQLGPLQDNGGPTDTHALLPGSPALDAGDPLAPATDQRGVPRPQGPAVDIGAFELEFTAPFLACPGNIVTNTAPEQCSRTVAFLVTASGLPAPVVLCTPPSGSVFPVGTNLVTCVASNVVGQDFCQFAVIVNDLDEPLISCPADVSVAEANPGDGSVAVSYALPAASDNCAPAPSLACVPAPGSSFPVGATTVDCTATDAAGNESGCAFLVTVLSRVIMVTSLADSGPGTLRQAMLDANAFPGLNRIAFNLPGPPPFRLLLLSALPPVNDPLMLDASQPGVELDGGVFEGRPEGGLAPASMSGPDGLVIATSNSTVRGLALYGFENAIRIEGTGNAIEACRLGTDANGTFPFGNVASGVLVRSPGNRVGGLLPGDGNVIAANGAAGVTFETTAASNSVVVGNFIGTDTNGVMVLGNAGAGVLFLSGAAGNTVGGTAPGAANVIAFNGAAGVGLDLLAGARNAILGNAIFSNAQLGLDLGNNGVTPNDPGDADGSPNQFQNFPVLFAASPGAGVTLVQGTLNSGSNQAYRLEFFTSASADASGHGEGAVFAGFLNVATDGAGNADFLATLPVTPPPGHVVSATATDAAGNTSEFSTTAAVTAPALPAITKQPLGTNVPLGGTVTLCVAAGGSAPLTIQWRLNGQNIPGATNTTFTILAAQLADGGTYTVAVQNPNGAVTSDPAVVVILVPQQPPGDNFADRVPLAGTSGLVSGTNNFATQEPGEPAHAGKSGRTSVWYTWTAPFSGIATFRTVGSTFDTLLAVYKGGVLTNLSSVASDDDHLGFFTSEVQFNAISGTAYHIAIDGYDGVAGYYLLGWEIEATGDPLPVITEQPASFTVGPGGFHTFSVKVFKRLVPFSFQWFFNGAPIAGATNRTYTVFNVQESSLGLYTVEVSLSNRVVLSSSAALQINLTGDEVRPVLAYDKQADALLSTNFLSLGLPPLGPASAPSLAPASAGVVRGYTGTQVFNNFGATTGTEDENYCGVVCGASEWVKFVPEEDGTLFVNTDGSTLDTVIAVYRRMGSNNTLTQLICDDPGGLDGLDSALSVAVTRGQTNLIVLDSRKGSMGTLKLNYSLVTPTALRALGMQPDGSFHLRVAGRSGVRFTLQRGTSVGAWLPLMTTNANAGGTFDLFDPAAPGAAGRFYRALILP